MIMSFEDLPPELRKKGEKVDRTRASNADRLDALEKQGAAFDLSIARIDHMLDQMCVMGVFTKEQLITMCQVWEDDLAKQLDNIEKQMNERQEMMRQEMMKQRLAVVGGKEGGLIGPNGRPLT